MSSILRTYYDCVLCQALIHVRAQTKKSDLGCLSGLYVANDRSTNVAALFNSVKPFKIVSA